MARARKTTSGSRAGARKAAAAEPLESLRGRIDAVDRQLHELINERARLARQVGVSKHADGHLVDFYRPEREAQVLRMALERNEQARATGVTSLIEGLDEETLARAQSAGGGARLRALAKVPRRDVALAPSDDQFLMVVQPISRGMAVNALAVQAASRDYQRILDGHYPRRSEDKDTSVSDSFRESAADYGQQVKNSKDPLMKLVSDLAGGAGDLGERVRRGFSGLAGFAGSGSGSSSSGDRPKDRPSSNPPPGDQD